MVLEGGVRWPKWVGAKGCRAKGAEVDGGGAWGQRGPTKVLKEGRRRPKGTEVGVEGGKAKGS